MRLWHRSIDRHRNLPWFKFNDITYVGDLCGTFSLIWGGDVTVVASLDPEVVTNRRSNAKIHSDVYFATGSCDLVSYKDGNFDGAGTTAQGITYGMAAGSMTNRLR